jgi:uncharacterized protein YjiS (DUF1127 family)
MAITYSTHPTTSIPVRSSQSFLPVLDRLAEALRRRQIRRIYGSMPDAQLQDIGLTWQDVVIALSLPLEKDAGEALAVAASIEAERW